MAGGVSGHPRASGSSRRQNGREKFLQEVWYKFYGKEYV